MQWTAGPIAGFGVSANLSTTTFRYQQVRVQRLRITFAREGEAKYLSHLEMMKAWERAFRRAGWKLSFSQGFNPHPKLSFAAALPVGVAAEADLLDVQIEEAKDPQVARSELGASLPPGLEVRDIQDIPVDAPPIQRALVAADYEAVCPEGPSVDLREAVERVLAAPSLPRRRAKEGKAVAYDLRPFINDLALPDGTAGNAVVRMRLRTDASGAGRADEVLRELGLDPAACRITRIRLVLS